jgi:hypothetical protein
VVRVYPAINQKVTGSPNRKTIYERGDDRPPFIKVSRHTWERDCNEEVPKLLRDHERDGEAKPDSRPTPTAFRRTSLE